MLFATWILLVLLLGTLVFAVVRVGAEPRDRTVTEPVAFEDSWAAGAAARSELVGNAGSSAGSVTGLYRGRTAETWAARFRHRTRQLQATRRLLRQRWQPTVAYALRLASVTYGVSHYELARVSECESHHFPFARNGIYRGLFQEGPMFEASPYGRAGFSVFDPVANALVAALTVSREGWRQWTCRP